MLMKNRAPTFTKLAGNCTNPVVPLSFSCRIVKRSDEAGDPAMRGGFGGQELQRSSVSKQERTMQWLKGGPAV